MQKIDIRAAISADLPALEELERLAFPDPWSPAVLRKEVLDGPGCVLVGTIGNTLAGYISLRFVADEVQLLRIATAAAYRRCGVAEQLLLRAVTEASDRRAVYMHLEVRKSNAAARALYEKHGFTVRAERPDAYTQPREDGYLMARDFGGTA